MKTVLHAYPKVLYQLILLYAFFQIASQIWINGSFFSDFDFNEGYLNEGKHILGPYMVLIGGFVYLIAGSISDQLKNVKYGLLIACLSMALGYIIHPIFSFPSSLLTQFGESLFFISIILNIAVLFPLANDWKDNAFVLLLVGSLIVEIFSSFLASFILEFGSSLMGVNSLMITAFLVLIGVAYYIWQSKNIGYEIHNDEEEEEETNTDTVVLIAITFLMFFFNTVIFFFTNAGNEYVYYNSMDGHIISINYLMSIGILSISFFLVVGYLLKITQYESRQFSKIQFGVLLIFVFSFLSLVSMYLKMPSLSFWIVGLASILSILLFLPPFLSILTHINIDKNAGLWIGIFIGFPRMGGFVVDKLANSINLQWYFYLGLLVALGAILIMMRENKDLILERLQLDEANQAEIEEEINILDHFIEE